MGTVHFEPRFEKFYGGQFWLNREDENGKKFLPDVPQDAFMASGHYGQSVVIIPSKNLVIVRLGLTTDRSQWDLNTFLKDIISVSDRIQ